jgi:hypothetical protein
MVHGKKERKKEENNNNNNKKRCKNNKSPSLVWGLNKKTKLPYPGYIGSNICKNIYIDNKRKRIPKVSSQMDNPEKLIT